MTRIVTMDGDLEEAAAGQSVTLTLADEIDVSRGDVIAAAGDPPEVADQFEATIVWMAEEAMLPGRPYWLKIGAKHRDGDSAGAEVSGQRQHVDHLAAKTLELNAIGVCKSTTDRAIVFEPYSAQPDSLAGSS